MATDRMSEEYSRFQILITGQHGSGKTSLIDAIFGTSLKEAIHDLTDTIQKIASPHNKHLLVHYHDSRGTGAKQFNIVKKFIAERNLKKHVSDRPHAIWLCITLPLSGNTGFILDESISKMIQHKANYPQYIFQTETTVPIIVVFTKHDLSEPRRQGEERAKNDKDDPELAKRAFNQRYCHVSAVLNKYRIPYTLVSIKQPETLRWLVQTTMKSIDNWAQSLSKRLESRRVFNRLSNHNQQASSGAGLGLLDLAQIALVTAQHVDMQAKVTASIKVGKKSWRAIIPSKEHSRYVTLENHFRKIHEGIITVWNIRGLHKVLADACHCRMISIIEDLDIRNRIDANTPQSNETLAPEEAGDAWKKDVYEGRPEQVRHLMRYAVDLILILKAVYQNLLGNQLQESDCVDEIIYGFVCSGKKKSVHDAIVALVEDQDEDEIESLIKENEINNNDMRFDQVRPLPTLLAILKIEISTRNIVNRITIDLLNRLLDSPSDLNEALRLETRSEVGLLLDFLLSLLHDGDRKNCGILNTNQKARKLMDKLSRKSVLPRTLSITDIEAKFSDDDLLGEGGFGKVFKGKRNGELVALKMLFGARHKGGSLQKDICREALAWRSLSHDFILPLLGIYEREKRLFLVSPYMENGTLVEWREKNSRPCEVEMYRLMLEVAQGVRYIHSQEIVHGDLSGANVLLDSNLRCKITDFGLSRHVEATITGSIAARTIHYTAPELFGICGECPPGACPHNLKEMERTKTMETDVYAFGCLYYAIFFDTVPFKGKSQYQIMWLLSNDECPDRLDKPRMSDDIWDLIKDCWLREASGRPTMKQINDRLACPPSLLVDLIDELTVAPARNDSMVNEKILDLMHRVSELPDDTIAFDLMRYAPNVNLLLDFVVCVLELRDTSSPTNSAIQNTGRKARTLMSKLMATINDVPSSLFISDVQIYNLDAIAMKRFGHGSYKGKEIMVQKLCKGGHNESGKDLLRKDPRRLREILLCRSLSDRFILPLLGIYEEKSYLFLVSPFVGGTVTQWRKDLTRVQLSPASSDFTITIHKAMLEVAKGIRYIHSEGIAHGKLHRENILLESSLESSPRCQITGFVSTGHSDATVTPATISFAAPELFDVVDGDHDVQKKMKIDVYSFGCLYYAVFFDTVPFHGKTDFEIMRLVKSGEFPDQLERPKMDDFTWNLLKSCWASDPWKRPTFEEIVKSLTPLPRRA